VANVDHHHVIINMCTALNTTRTQITVVNAHRFGTHRFMLDDKDLVFVMYKHTDTSYTH
jgi:hypothetical protein